MRALVEQPPREAMTSKATTIDTGWQRVERCPACYEQRIAESMPLRISEYRLADEILDLPEGGIDLMRCSRCGLLFKDVVPTPDSLSQRFARNVEEVWSSEYEFRDERRLIEGLSGAPSADVLDVGASDGSLLEALSNRRGRRSALDVVMHPDLSGHLSGEFIEGFIDEAEVRWQGRPYDVVTAFDVIEHLYDPGQAFVNLRRFVKPGGFVVLETGDSESLWPRTFGAGRWWYTALLAHHVFWSDRSLRHNAAQHGFRVLRFEQKRHKSRSLRPTRSLLKEAAKAMIYRSAPRAYAKVAGAAGKASTQPSSPFVKDHFRAVLQRL